MSESGVFGLEIDELAGEMVLTNYLTHDVEVVKYFAFLAEDQRQAQFDLALKLGVIVLRILPIAPDVHYVKECFESIFQETFGPEGRIVKEIFDPSKDGTPLAKLKNDIIPKLTELTNNIARLSGERETVARTTIKGREFEVAFEEMLSKLAEPHADEVENTTDRPGRLALSKKGDFVVTLSENPDLRMVFEVKDIDRIDLPELKREMKEAMENRDASYGIFVAKRVSTLPRSVGWFNEYDGNVLAVALGGEEEEGLHHEMLEIAYKWARLRLWSGRGRAIRGIDVKAIQDKIDEAGGKLRTLSKIKTDCTAVENHIKDIRETTKDIQSSIRNILDGILEEVRRAITEPEES